MKTTFFLGAVAVCIASAVSLKGQSQGAVQAWAQRYSAPAETIFTDQKLVVDPAGNVIVAGTGNIGSGSDWVLIKYVGAGVALWTNYFSGSTNESASASGLAVDTNGNVIVTGQVSTTTNQVYATIKYSSSGVPLWTNRYVGPGRTYDSAAAVAVDGSGNVVVTGSSIGTNQDYATIKYSSAGVPLWTNRYDTAGSSFDQAIAVAVDGNGNVIVTGFSDYDEITEDFATVAYSSAGVSLWTNRFNGTGTGYSTPNALSTDASGKVFVAGYSDDPDGIDSDFVTIAYSGAGVPLWTNVYHGTGASYRGAAAVAVDGSGNVLVTGSTSNGTDQDYTTIKYSSAGTALWTNHYSASGTSYDIATALSVGTNGSVFVTGFSDYSDGSADYGTVAYSEAGATLWTNRYNNTGFSYDTATALAVDTSSNVFVTGESAISFATLKYSGTGVPLWTNRFNDEVGNAIDNAAAVIVDGSGNLFVTGPSVGIGSGYDFATIKYSSAGIPLWINRYNGPSNGNDVPFVMATDSGGSVIVAGYSWSGSNFDYALIKYSNAGVALWTNRYNGPANLDDYANAIALDSSDSVFVAGSSMGSGVGYDFAAIKYSSAGVPLWTNRYNGPANGDDFANAIALDASGNAFVTGSATVNVNGDADYATIEYSGAGLPLWTNRYNGPGNGDDQAFAAAVDSSGNLFVTGMSIGSGTFDDYDYATIKYSGAGALLWIRRYSGPYVIDTASRLAVDTTGNVIVTGSSLSPTSGYDYLTVKYSGAGVALWTNRYDGSGHVDDIANGVAVDTNGNVLVCGSSYGSDSSQDFAIVDYSSAGVPVWTNRYNGPGNGKDYTGVMVRNSTVAPFRTSQTVVPGRDGSVYVTGSSDVGSHGVASDFVTIKYVVPPKLVRPGLTNSLFAFTISGSSGASVEIQGSTNLQSWSPLITNILIDGTNYFTDLQSTNVRRFYRARLLP